jgi:hypothetical protein
MRSPPKKTQQPFAYPLSPPHTSKMAQFMDEVHGFLEEDLMVPSPLDMDIKVRACERPHALLCSAAHIPSATLTQLN